MLFNSLYLFDYLRYFPIKHSSNTMEPSSVYTSLISLISAELTIAQRGVEKFAVCKTSQKVYFLIQVYNNFRLRKSHN